MSLHGFWGVIEVSNLCNGDICQNCKLLFFIILDMTIFDYQEPNLWALSNLSDKKYQCTNFQYLSWKTQYLVSLQGYRGVIEVSNWCNGADLPKLQTIVLHIWLFLISIIPMRRFPISILNYTTFGVLTRFLRSNWGQQLVQWANLPKLQNIVLHCSRCDYFCLSRAKSLSFIKSIRQKIPMRRFPISILKNSDFGVLLRFLGSNWGRQLVQWGRYAKIANYCSSLF